MFRCSQTLSLEQLEELVETVFASVDDQMVEGSGVHTKLRFQGAMSEFVNHPIIESYLAESDD